MKKVFFLYCVMVCGCLFGLEEGLETAATPMEKGSWVPFLRNCANLRMAARFPFTPIQVAGGRGLQWSCCVDGSRYFTLSYWRTGRKEQKNAFSLFCRERIAQLKKRGDTEYKVLQIKNKKNGGLLDLEYSVGEKAKCCERYLVEGDQVVQVKVGPVASWEDREREIFFDSVEVRDCAKNWPPTLFEEQGEGLSGQLFSERIEDMALFIAFPGKIEEIEHNGMRKWEARQEGHTCSMMVLKDLGRRGQGLSEFFSQMGERYRKKGYQQIYGKGQIQNGEGGGTSGHIDFVWRNPEGELEEVRIVKLGEHIVFLSTIRHSLDLPSPHEAFIDSLVLG